jgi:hypothetical protein
MVPAIVAALVAAAAAPDPVAGLTATLSSLASGRAPISVLLEHHLTVQTGDERPAPEGVVRGTAADGPAGLELRWSRDVLGQAAREEAQQATDADAPTPTRDALTDLDPLAVGQLLDAAPLLLRGLERPTLLEDRDDVLDGVPMRLLVLKLDPALRSRDKKYVKQVDATARVWLGTDGVPVAVESRVHVKGRAFLVISFESERRDAYRLARVGDRLVAVRRERDVTSDGGGERGRRHTLTTVTVTP